VRDSTAAGNSGNGIWANSPSAAVFVSVDSSAAINNGATGVLANGSSLILLNYSVVTGNSTGVSFTSGASLQSYNNNSIDANLVANGAPSGTLTPE
jgi:hypothetical protein